MPAHRQPEIPPSPAARRLAEAKRLAKEAYTLARGRGAQAVPMRLQRVATHTTAIARVAVVGERKRGKSTLINALLGQPDLVPRDVDVATNTYIEVISPRRLGLPDVAQARVHLQSGSVVEAGIDEVGRWGSEQFNPGNARGVAFAQVLLPHPLLDTGLVLLDTPGLGGLRGAHGTMTLTALEQADAVLLVLSAAAPATNDELEYLDRARRRVERAIIVQSAGPEATDPHTVANADRDALDRRDPALAAIPMLVVSPLDAHDALAEPDPAVARELQALSGIAELVQRLLADILEPALERQATLLIGEVQACLDELAGPDRELLATLAGANAATALQNVTAELAAAERASPVTAFDAGFGEVRREADAAMQARIARDRDELLDRIEDHWSERLGGSLGERCRLLLAEAATETTDRLAGGAGRVAAEVARQHSLGDVTLSPTVTEAEFKLDLPGRPKAARQIDQERMLGWLTRGGPLLMIGFATLNPVFVGIGIAIVAASEQMQGTTSNRRRAREWVQRVVTRGQLELRTVVDERAKGVRTAFADDLQTRHNARVERLRSTQGVLRSGSDAQTARARAAEIDGLQNQLRALSPHAVPGGGP